MKHIHAATHSFSEYIMFIQCNLFFSFIYRQLALDKKLRLTFIEPHNMTRQIMTNSCRIYSREKIGINAGKDVFFMRLLIVENKMNKFVFFWNQLHIRHKKY